MQKKVSWATNGRGVVEKNGAFAKRDLILEAWKQMNLSEDPDVPLHRAMCLMTGEMQQEQFDGHTKRGAQAILLWVILTDEGTRFIDEVRNSIRTVDEEN
tara:strand:- start:19630 stop:19929 length:300 start_codon:yes stop_codon:yes gene_type:complete